MLFPSSGLGAALALAATASAIIIPPNLGIESIDNDKSIETLGADAYKQAVTIDCPGCPVASGGKRLKWTQDVGTSYLLDFEIGQDFATLDISGVQLYPPSFSHFSEPFTVSQVDAAESDKSLHLRITGYSFHYNSAETISEAGTELLPMTFQITSVESQSVSPPALHIFLLKDNAGRLMIASIQPAPAEAIEASPKEQTKECSKAWPLLCKWKSIVADKIEAMKTRLGKGCHKGKRPGAHGKHHRPGRPHHRPHYAEGQEDHRPHRHHHHHSKAAARMRWVLFTIIFPIIVGIFAGALTYVIGMVIGSAIALLWAKVRGIQAGAYESVAQHDEEDVDVKGSDKEVYRDLPEYEGEAPPVYEEAAEKEVVTGDN